MWQSSSLAMTDIGI